VRHSRRFVIRNIQGAWDKRAGDTEVEGKARERCQRYYQGLLLGKEHQGLEAFKRNNQNQPEEKLDLNFKNQKGGRRRMRKLNQSVDDIHNSMASLPDPDSRFNEDPYETASLAL
jgi:hypothetical protein